MTDNSQTSPLELVQAQQLVRWLTGQTCKLIATPDAPGNESRPGGNPEAVVEDISGERYVVEVKRLLTPEIRALEDFVNQRIAGLLNGMLLGTFTLTIQMVGHRLGKLDRDTAASVVQEVRSLISSGRLQDSQILSSGFPLDKVHPEGNRIVPFIVGPSLPHDLKKGDPVVDKVQRLFEEQVRKADRKFAGWQGNRIFLMDTGQSGLDVEFHAQEFKDGQGILLAWAEKVCRQTEFLDFFLLEPGVHVWQVSSSSGEGPQIYAGTKWVDQPRGFYIPLWRRPNHPPLGRFRY